MAISNPGVPVGVLALLIGLLVRMANGAPPESLLDGKVSGVSLVQDSKQVSTERIASGIKITIAPGEDGYPGFSIYRENRKDFDLSAFGHLKATITNTGDRPLDIALRADNSGDWKDEPYNSENIILEPGQQGTIHLIFGHSFGRKKGFALNSSAITRLLVFTGKTDHEKSFRIDSIIAGGEPGEAPPPDPEKIRLLPQDGALYLAGGAGLPVPRLESRDGAVLKPEARGIVAGFHKAASKAVVMPEYGRWDLSQSLRVVVTLSNEGKTIARPVLQLHSDGGPSDEIHGPELAPGATADFAIPFIAATPWRGRPDFVGKGEGTLEGTGSRLTSDAVSAVIIGAGAADAVLSVRAIRSDVPPPPSLPAWLGKRPPVEGDWAQTFTDEFDGSTIDDRKWNVHAANHWDKASWFSRDNVITGGGFTRLRYEKRTGHHNDDPAGKELHYATGVLDTYGKWTQRYGYFEVRVKLPTAPGLWPAFWLMPERGKDTGEQWQRQDTGNGGMEFDVVEHLTRWGPYRNNIAMHWDGYGEDHKHFGTDRIYMQPDKDGFVTAGLLWLPGQATYYIHGNETAHWENPRISSVPSCLLFTLPQGGWDNSPVDDSRLPDDFVIDYVRIWQRKDLQQH